MLEAAPVSRNPARPQGLLVLRPAHTWELGMTLAWGGDMGSIGVPLGCPAAPPHPCVPPPIARAQAASPSCRSRLPALWGRTCLCGTFLPGPCPQGAVAECVRAGQPSPEAPSCRLSPSISGISGAGASEGSS